MIAAEEANHSVARLCENLEVSRSGYYDWRRRETLDLERSMLIHEVKRLHGRKRGSLGSRRMAAKLRESGYSVGRHRARSLMREAGVECHQRRRFRATTLSDHRRPVAPNLLQRDFSAERPNEAWLADITAVWTLQGWVYLAAVLDVYDRQIVGWAMDEHMRSDLATRALEMAIGRRRPPHGLIHHSDRGSQYASVAYQQLLQRNGLTPSMSRKGDCWDNAPMERFFGTLKTDWTGYQRYRTRQAAYDDIARFIELEYNSDHNHSSLGYLTPREQEMAAVA